MIALSYVNVLLRDATFAERRATLIDSQPSSEKGDMGITMLA